MSSKSPTSSEKRRIPDVAMVFLVLLLVISLLLGGAFLPGRTLFSNDGPLARLVSQCHHLPDAFAGVWEDLNSVGYREQGALPNITYGFRLLVKPVLFSKFYAALALIILGLGAWCFFRQLKLATAACMLGGLAAALNSDFFSTACWGVASHPLTVGLTFFAMAALVKTSSWRGWLQAVLAGAAVGMGLAEGADVGAIFSLYVAAFAMYQAWIAEGPRLKNLATGAGRVMVVAGFAAFVAAQAIFALVNTQIEGVTGMGQDTQTKEQHWLWATRWSLPKREALGLVVPGLFGYRLDTPSGGSYWGALGRSAAWEEYLAKGQIGDHPHDILRQTGSGIYAGVTVVLVGLWAAVQSFRRDDLVFNSSKRKWLWFWLGVLVISFLLGFGRHAPFYRLIYSLPYFSTIRNPVKFFAVVNFALVVLFAYGVDGLWRTYLEPVRAGSPRRSPAAMRFDKFWMQGCLAALGLGLVGWLIYSNYYESLRIYLESVQFNPARAQDTAAFSIRQVGWFVLFLMLAAGVMGLMITGHFAGARARWGAVVLGAILVLDLGRADLPWIISWNYQEKYASNPVIEMLRQKPYEHRVAILPMRGPAARGILDDLYTYEWAQQHFQYYDIQSLDVVQLPRLPEDLAEFRKATLFDGTMKTADRLVRRWELTNTRYLLGTTEFFAPLNDQVDPRHEHRFQILTRFDLVPESGVPRPQLADFKAVPSPNGEFALFEFTGALPRAKLFSSWQINTNTQATLDQMMSPAFDPARTVLVSGGLPAAAASSSTNENAGTVDFVSYASKDVVLNAQAAKPSVLLLNDRLDPNWKVWVDGNSAPILRCNYLMRGVYLEPGTHKVEFRFQPPVGALYVSLAAIGISLLVGGVLVVTLPRNKVELPSPVMVKAVPPRNNGAEVVPAPKAAPPAKPKSKQPAGKGRR
ncbi:MAG: hypothetical protein JWQ04_3404 [Pedosphaera sp.]|nr:hypothetical protein [Pedosphaera sp.]